jgi:ribosome-associated protein
VNKVASAIHLRFDIANCSALPDAVKGKLLALRDRRITTDGIVVIKAQSFRTQEKNIKEATQRLASLIASALVEDKPRRKTKISRVKKKKRVDEKRKRGQLKQDRRRIDND